MAEINLSAADLILVSLALEDRELILRNIGSWKAAKHMADLRQRWDGFCIDADVTEQARLTTEAA